MILPSAGAPGETKAEGAACWGSPSLGPSAALQGLRSGYRPSGQGGMAVRGGRPYVGATGYSHQRYAATQRPENKLREHQRQYLDQLLYYLAASVRTDDVVDDRT